MGRQRADEREHRRGLVLGLTLAEALLLLLFLLLLAMGSKISAVKRAAEQAPSVTQAPQWSIPNGVIMSEPIGATAQATGVVVGSPIVTGSINTGAEKPDLAVTAALQQIQKVATEFDPADPPAALKRIQEIVQILPRDASALEELRQAMQTLEARKPNASPAELKRAIAILDRLPADAKPEEVIVKPKESVSRDSKEHPNWPPIITLSEADGFYFGSGSAELSPEQRRQLSGSVVDALVKIVDQYSDVNVIEVIGHTDEQPIGVRPSNLDGSLFARLQGDAERPEMISADNAGLGLARAVAVSEVLLQQKRLTKFRILPLSAAQLIDLNDDLPSGRGPKDFERRRRIEIRVRRSERISQIGRYDRKPLLVPKPQPVKQDSGGWSLFFGKF